MKAISIIEANRCELVDIPKPAAPGAGEVRLKVRQVGFCGSDLTSFRGLTQWSLTRASLATRSARQLNLLALVCPRQWKVGQNVLVSPYTSCGQCSACKAGRFNACRYNETMGVQRDGALTEYVNIPHEKLFTSDKLSLAEMALVEPLTVGFHAVSRGETTAR